MKLDVTENQNCIVMKITGRIDSYTAPKIKQNFQTFIDEGQCNFVVDMNDVNYLSSSGILMFVNMYKQLSNQNLGKIVFSKVPELIYSNFKLAGFDNLFEFHKDTKSALQRF